MSRRRRTATRGWRSIQRRAKKVIELLLERKALAKTLGWNHQQERELQYHLNQGN